MNGRRPPYTEIGIKRIPCARCGKPSVHQWQVSRMTIAIWGPAPTATFYSTRWFSNSRGYPIANSC